jgi:hypothetical protein
MSRGKALIDQYLREMTENDPECIFESMTQCCQRRGSTLHSLTKETKQK